MWFELEEEEEEEDDFQLCIKKNIHVLYKSV